MRGCPEERGAGAAHRDRDGERGRGRAAPRPLEVHRRDDEHDAEVGARVERDDEREAERLWRARLVRGGSTIAREEAV